MKEVEVKQLFAPQQLVRGDSCVLKVWLSRTPSVGEVLLFTAKDDITKEDAQAIVQKTTGLGLTHGETRWAFVELVPQDTENLEGNTKLWCDIQAVTLDGARTTLAMFSVMVQMDVSQEASPSVPIYTTQPGNPPSGPVDYVQFTVTPQSEVPTAEGAVSWNPTDHTLNLQTEVLAVVQQVGQELLVPVKNNTGAKLDDGTAVAITGSTGDRMTVEKAIATSDVHANSFIGIVTADIASSGEGYVTVFGRVRGLDTNSLTPEGSVVWLSAVTAGALTTTKPTSPAWAIKVGTVEKKAGSPNGRIFVSPQRMSVSSAEVVDATKVGRSVLTAEDAAVARGVLGATSMDVIKVSGTLNNGVTDVIFPDFYKSTDYYGRELFTEDGRDWNLPPTYTILNFGIQWTMTHANGGQWKNTSTSVTVPLTGWTPIAPATGTPILTRINGHRHQSSDITDATSTPSAGKVMLWPTTYKRHVQLDAKADGSAASQAIPVDVGVVGGLQFPNNSTRYAYCQFEVPDDWAGTDIQFEVDWFPQSAAVAAGETVKWNLAFYAVKEGETFNPTAPAGTTITVTGVVAQYKTTHTKFTLPANTPIESQDHVFVRITRDTSDTFESPVVVTAYEMIYDSVGFPTSN